jgi:ferredoxin-NADP reductase
LTARLIMKMSVREIVPLTRSVKLYTLAHPRRGELPAPTPGAHVDVHLPGGKVRQYSLCGDPDDVSVYRIAVKREDPGRGASRWIHDNVNVGAIVPVSAPRSNFPLSERATRHVFVAGGIGITPIVAMVTRLARGGLPFELHYCARSVDEAPFLEELRDLCGHERLFVYCRDGDQPARFDADRLVKTTPEEADIYCCGPQRLTQAVRAAMARWPHRKLHSEVFQPTADENFNPEPFDVKIASTGEVVRIPASKSALEVLRARGFALPSSCELGVCGACECRFLDGMVIHRDAVLDTAARQDRMMLCVSRARVGVTLDL